MAGGPTRVPAQCSAPLPWSCDSGAPLSCYSFQEVQQEFQHSFQHREVTEIQRPQEIPTLEFGDPASGTERPESEPLEAKPLKV